jgi:endo-1,4-beta-xylanase
MNQMISRFSRGTNPKRTKLWSLAAVFILAAASVSCVPVPQAPPTPPPPCNEPVCPLATAARDRDVQIGAAVNAGRLATNPAYADAIRRHFTSVTPENELKWSILRPSPTQYNWGPADSIVDFAEANNLAVRGHTLAWVNETGDQNGLPSWLRGVTDPEAFRTYVLEGVTEVVGHYRGRIDRWDVVNERLEYVNGALAPSVYDRMGPDYVADLFEAAHAADPDASLWINEVFTEYFPDKAQALVGLVTSLRNSGVPIHGVGLQTHLTLTPEAPAAGAIGGLVTQLRNLGVEVAVTELDVPLGPLRSEQQQVATYRQVATEALAAGANEITVWGVTDAFTTLDSDGQRKNNPGLRLFFDLPSKPLLLDTSYNPKAAYQAVVEAIEQAPGQ